MSICWLRAANGGPRSVTRDIPVTPLPAWSSDPSGLIRALGFLQDLLVAEAVF